MTESPKVPLLSEATVAALEKLYPDRVPDPHMTEREIWMHVGKVQVVRMLRQEIERRKETNEIY